MRHRLLLDTSSLVYRAFFALPESITAPDGQPVNAVRGYLDMTARLLVDRRPDVVVHVFDADWRPAERVAAYQGYKEKRPPEPETLTPQFALLPEVLAAAGQPVAQASGWEADDAIAALCAATAEGERVEVVTGDRDLLQLVRDPVVRVLYTVTGVRDLAVFDEAAVAARHGVPPARYVDYAILRGDPSDGLPGVPGVGEKTAQRLVARYPSLDALLADVDAQPPRLAERLRSAAGYLEAMRHVVPARGDVAVQVETGERDDEHLAALSARWGLAGPVRRLQEALDA
jgi:5'-3' exonuclease